MSEKTALLDKTQPDKTQPDKTQPDKTQRHGFVDALRGFSLLGILLVNIEFIVQPAEIGWNHYADDIDKVVRWLIVALGQTKIYPLFALLFGYGLAIQIRKAEERGGDLWPRYRRRMIGLVLLGIAHGILFFPGDILVIYAVIGGVAYRFRNLETHQLIRAAAWVYAIAALAWLGLGSLESLVGDAEAVNGSINSATVNNVTANSAKASGVPADSLRILSEGSFAEVVMLHFFYWLFTLAILVVIQGPAVIACFFSGVALGRTDWLANPDAHRSLAKRVLVRWFPLGLFGASLGASCTLLGGRWETLGFAFGFAAAPFVAAGYLAILALYLSRYRIVSAALQAAGRMSLTVYLLESVLATTVAYGYGGGAFGRTGPLAGVGWALLIFTVLLLFALAWMRVARFGPFEWLLRWFTYATRPELLRPAGKKA